jgi:hypothetical protein
MFWNQLRCQHIVDRIDRKGDFDEVTVKMARVFEVDGPAIWTL